MLKVVSVQRAALLTFCVLRLGEPLIMLVKAWIKLYTFPDGCQVCSTYLLIYSFKPIRDIERWSDVGGGIYVILSGVIDSDAEGVNRITHSLRWLPSLFHVPGNLFLLINEGFWKLVRHLWLRCGLFLSVSPFFLFFLLLSIFNSFSFFVLSPFYLLLSTFFYLYFILLLSIPLSGVTDSNYRSFNRIPWGPRIPPIYSTHLFSCHLFLVHLFLRQWMIFKTVSMHA